MRTLSLVVHGILRLLACYVIAIIRTSTVGERKENALLVQYQELERFGGHSVIRTMESIISC